MQQGDVGRTIWRMSSIGPRRVALLLGCDRAGLESLRDAACDSTQPDKVSGSCGATRSTIAHQQTAAPPPPILLPDETELYPTLGLGWSYIIADGWKGLLTGLSEN